MGPRSGLGWGHHKARGRGGSGGACAGGNCLAGASGGHTGSGAGEPTPRAVRERREGGARGAVARPPGAVGVGLSATNGCSAREHEHAHTAPPRPVEGARGGGSAHDAGLCGAGGFARCVVEPIAHVDRAGCGGRDPLSARAPPCGVFFVGGDKGVAGADAPGHAWPANARCRRRPGRRTDAVSCRPGGGGGLTAPRLRGGRSDETAGAAGRDHPRPPPPPRSVECRSRPRATPVTAGVGRRRPAGAPAGASECCSGGCPRLRRRPSAAATATSRRGARAPRAPLARPPALMPLRPAPPAPAHAAGQGWDAAFVRSRSRARTGARRGAPPRRAHVCRGAPASAAPGGEGASGSS
jgi:hypothetical protein